MMHKWGTKYSYSVHRDNNCNVEGRKESTLKSQKILRVGVPGALLAAFMWTVSGGLAFVFPGPNMGAVGSLSWHLIEASDVIAEAGMLAAMVGLHVRQTPKYGWMGTLGFVVAFLGTASVMVATVHWLLTRVDGGFIDIVFNAGAVGALVGIPLLGFATLRGGILPRWCGLLLMAWLVYFPLIFFLVDLYGEARALFGLVWLAVAYALLATQSAPLSRRRAEVRA